MKIMKAVESELKKPGFLEKWLDSIQNSVIYHEFLKYIEDKYVNNEDYIKQMIGCESTCPICEIKCSKNANH